MRNLYWIVPAAFIEVLALTTRLPLSSTDATAAEAVPSATRDSSPSSQPANADQATLERQLSKMLSGATLKGSWRMSDDLRAHKPLGAARPERYEIVSAHKEVDDWWIIRARIQYADNDVTLPIRLRVVWAGDTPILTVDEIAFPGLGTYSARVMFYRDYYCGTWFGNNYGGVMSGEIVRKDAKDRTP